MRSPSDVSRSTDPTSYPVISSSSSTSPMQPSSTSPMQSVTSNQNRSYLTNTNIKIIDIIQNFLIGIAFGGAALSFDLERQEVAFSALVGFLLKPAIGLIVTYKSQQRLKPSVTTTTLTRRQMSKEEALSMLNVPLDRANDLSFIKERYENMLKALTPKHQIDPSSELGALINNGIADIEQAHVALK